MKNSINNNINIEESLIYPTFKDERIDSFIKEDYNISKYKEILLNTINNINNIKEIILLLLNKNSQSKENEFLTIVSEYNIDIKTFLTYLFFLKRRISLLYDLQEKKITIYDYIAQNQNPFFLHKQMIDENNIKNEETVNSVDNKENDLFYKLYKEENDILTRISFLKNNYSPNIKSFCIGLNILNMLLNDVYIIFKLFLNSQNISDIGKDKQLFLFKTLFKIQSCGLLFCNLYFLGKESIFNKDENSKEWVKAKNKMKRINVSNRIDINNTLNEINKNLSVAFCSMNQLEKYTSNNYILDNSMKGALMAYYYIRKKEAKYQADKFLINPDINICQKIWGLTETKESKKLIKIVLPHIEFRETFYISRNENDIINNDVINKLTNKIKDENFQININDDCKSINNNLNIDKIVNKISKNETIFDNENIESNPKKSERFKSKKELKSINKKEKKLNYIKIVLMHNNYLKTTIEEDNSFFNNILCCNINPKSYNNMTKDSIIFHIHGGGFITLSPLSHENYTRKIVNKTGIPLLSIDYRLSPEYSFPSALDDVYQVYNWVIEKGENDLNLKINNIIMLGDSAGGNLILSLIYILMIRGIKIPSMIILVYPAVKMNIIPLSLSYLNSIYDPLLDYNLLSFCLKSYLGENSDDNNPFLSPLYMDNKIIKNLPKLKIYGGTGDPLRDDYIEFFHKCINENIDCELIEFKYFPHGFLNYDYSFIMPQASECTERISEDIINFINSKFS